ncbi:hypothetical protein DVS28_b0274 (plasmid) [Euzebya pacifica]|uniref:Uncharacterized protein n=1 Tax=Euzebya pacifica TaxID=1608957 RepID=A0A346Y6E7_9ACTN|nr:hypothetical protein [Euzebya pacifica]AXV10044.1 hypothetical protein DVS28_b0274 [Euzebya pacifica]
MNERLALLTAFAVTAAVVVTLDATPARVAEAITHPSKASALAAFVSAGGAVIAGAVVVAALWAVRSAFASEETIRGASLFDEVTAEQAAHDDRIVAEAERILRDHKAPTDPDSLEGG